MIEPSVLILASRFDLTCDYVVAGLRRLGVTYLRLNSEDMGTLQLSLEPVAPQLRVILDGVEFLLQSKTLRSILFRRPVYNRDYGDDHRSPEARFSAIQWSTFIRNLAVFEKARWYNEPASTYRAEHKAIQLSTAIKIGFNVPKTLITNNPYRFLDFPNECQVALKGLDTVMIRDAGQETFGFTTFSKVSELSAMPWASAPGIIQESIEPKLDIRVTAIEDKLFSTAVTINNSGVQGDWRAHKRDVKFSPFELPRQISSYCISLLRHLGLRFGAIDLALTKDTYYFLEINPTGEWAWLVDAACHPIDKALAHALSRQNL